MFFNKKDDKAFKYFGSTYMVYYDNGNPSGTWGKDFGCQGTGGNCIEPIVITNLIKVFSFQLAYKVSTGTAIEIREYFTVNQTELGNILDNRLVDDVVAGELYVRHRGGIDEESFVLIFVDENDENQVVQPFVI